MASSGLPPPNSRDDFEIAIVCALAVEYDAVTLLVDKFWNEDGDKYGRAIGDQNTYATGRMGSFDIVLVLLPNAGKVSAASAASSFRSSFPKITLALLVGICGGVPYTQDKEEILLGDVVISKTVIQYDLGRQYHENFHTKETLEDRLGRPGTNIRSILAVMETNLERERLENRAAVLLEQLQLHAGRKKTRKPVNYEYPGKLKDRLFEPSYVHKHQVLLPYRCCEEVPCDHSHTLSCDDLGCENKHLVQRQRLNDQAQNLSIFIGRFGSGDTSLKSGIYRDQVAQRHGLLAFEMEGAGIWDELPCIIIKGVSNYADGHWDADSGWQHFAAATAAATARALIERYPKTDRPHFPLVVKESRRKRTQEEEECLRDMHVTDPSLDKKRIEDTNGGLLKDSYVWILSNAEFIRWRTSLDGGLLWIKGDPGKGKTMLLCGLINELQAEGATRLYYFFCQASDSRLNSATKVLCSLVYSIACEDEQALSYVMEKYKHAGKELFHNINAWSALSQIMMNILPNMSLKDKVFIIDGLDECVVDLPLLLDFIAQAPGLSEARWIVSSRNWPNIEEKLKAISKKLPLSLELNERSVSDAVRVYIQHKVDQLAIRKNLDESSCGAIQAHLTDNANGTFLWVSLVCKKLFDGDVRKRHLPDLMRAFPSGLVPLYERMMAQVCESQDAQICLQVLEMISLTYRPISLMELTSFAQLAGDDDGIEELKDIVATCGSFLVLKDEVVYFVHQSAKDFLLNNTSKQIFTRGIAHKHHDIFSKSIQILSQTLRQDMYNLRHPGAQKKEASIPNPDPLAPLRYACLFWVDHLRDAVIISSGQDVSQTSLQDEGSVHSFLKACLLYWLEAFCLMDKLSEGIYAIRTLRLLTTQDSGQLHLFVSDARRLALMFRAAIEYTPLQLYSSVLLFAPTSSIIRQTFELNKPKWIIKMPSVRPDWDACLQTLEGHRDVIFALAFSPDNTKLASYSPGNIKIWDRATGACLRSLAFDHSTGFPNLAFSPDSSQLAVSSTENTKILDLNTGACVMTLDDPLRISRGAMRYSPDGMQLILSNKLWEDGSFQIWDLTKVMQLQKKDYYQDIGEPAVSQLDTSGMSYFTSGMGYVTVIRSPVTGTCVQVVSQDRPDKVVFTLDGTQFALAIKTEEKSFRRHLSIYILDAATGICLQKFPNHDWHDECWTLSPDGSQLAMASLHDGIRIWDVKTGALLYTFSAGVVGHYITPAFSLDGEELASVADGTVVKIWDLTLGSSVKSEEIEHIWSIMYSPDGTRLALIRNYTKSYDAFTIEIWDPVEERCQQKLQIGDPMAFLIFEFKDIARLAFSPDNTQLAYSRGNEVAIRDLATNTHQNRVVFRASGSIESIVFSPSGTRLAVADIPIWRNDVKTLRADTPKIEIWDATNGAIVHTFYSAIGISAMQFSSDGKRLGSRSIKGITAIWDLDTGTCLETLDLLSEKKLHSEKIYFAAAEILGKDFDLIETHYRCFLAKMLQNPGSRHSGIHEFDLSSNGKWLLRQGEPFLWLPPEYRPQTMTFARGNIAMILSHKRLLLLCLNVLKLDAEMASNRL